MSAFNFFSHEDSFSFSSTDLLEVFLSVCDCPQEETLLAATKTAESLFTLYPAALPTLQLSLPAVNSW